MIFISFLSRTFFNLTTVLLLLFSCTTQAEERVYITIGTGAVTGVYYPAGSSICKLINKGRLKHHIRCSVESTAGSVDNINALRMGKMDAVISQSDWQYQAFKGNSDFKSDSPYTNMRALFSLYSEPFNIIARRDSDIQNIHDLEGKRVNIGNIGSGDRATIDMLMKQFSWTNKSFSLVTEYTGAGRAQALCDNKIDAFISIIGHPNASIKEATTACQARLVPATGKHIDQLINQHPYYAHTSVPANLYLNNDKDIQSFGMLSVVSVDRSLSDEVAYQITKAVFENFDTFKRLHPAFSLLKKENMIKDGISVPLHTGAIRYYKEVGLL
ncbi:MULTISPECIES: TAXI family TRAP transporter solute-binding subunit [Vibrio]|uniref:C4-dicarboxylate ABC transporter substrate-binding protein n=1 Tax=Vibrio casei TaxID=673372 RepID=A0A368LKQ7_9VIBR|nr:MULTISPECIES: TAXI family TRAP transporter solute-binding subunit [Vibrio]RCS72452.1 C4-dicarboxylate ABC transporter substrate-binding protein [Vibrio casei]SJN36665.1 TRAP transporter solute receptor, TAXI family precursor [Vibrio casei]HBV75210.1 C4-dicarboxylate ABC transporter substrate-binding protein [Vibrio sp.]